MLVGRAVNVGDSVSVSVGLGDSVGTGSEGEGVIVGAADSAMSN